MILLNFLIRELGTPFPIEWKRRETGKEKMRKGKERRRKIKIQKRSEEIGSNSAESCLGMFFVYQMSVPSLLNWRRSDPKELHSSFPFPFFFLLQPKCSNLNWVTSHFFLSFFFLSQTFHNSFQFTNLKKKGKIGIQLRV